MKTIKKAMNGMGPGPKKKPSFLVDQKGDTLKVGTKAYAAEKGRRDVTTKALMTESPKAKEEAAKKKTASLFLSCFLALCPRPILFSYRVSYCNRLNNSCII